MTPVQAIVFGIIILALLLFIWGRWRYDLVAMLVLLAAVVLGVVPWNQAFAGFAHPAVVTVAAVLILSRSLLNSGSVDLIYRWLSRVSNSPTLQAVSLTGLVAFLSGFMNNVGALAILMPVGVRMARRGGSPPSIFLMPLAFGSLLGGMVTLIGTPPNIIFSTFRAENVGEPFRMFDFAPVGVGVVLAGIIFISMIGWRLIPLRKGPKTRGEIFKVENYFTEVRVPEGSMMAGKSLMEAVVMNDSSLVGKTGGSLCMRQRYGINLIALARQDAKNLKHLSQISFLPGDVLLLQGPPEALPGILELLGCLPLAERGLRLGQAQNIFLPLIIFGFAVVETAVGTLPVEIAFAGAATAMVLVGLLTLQEAYESVDWSIIIFLGAMIPVSQALESTGGAELFASALLQALGQFPAEVVLAVLLILTIILTNAVNNAAAAVLMAPISLNAAFVLGASPDPFLMAAAIGSSCAFLTPIGHQSNTLVMGPGGYKFGDYWHMGLPLSVIIVLVAVPLILVFWPLGVD